MITEPKYYSKEAVKIYCSFGKIYFLEQIKKRPSLAGLITIAAVKLALHIDKAFINRFPKLKIIATNTTALTHIDESYAAGHGIKIVSLKGATDFLNNVHATAEFTWALILSLTRKIPWGFESLKNGKWQRDEHAGRELNDKVLGILGFGRLGRQVAKYGRAFGMKVIACDPFVASSEMKKNHVSKVSQTDLLKQADIISTHVVLNKQTQNLIGDKQFGLMKKTAVFVNTSRGELIDEQALLTALTKGKISGAATDVLKNELSVKNNLLKNPLVKYARVHDNLLLAPHLGGATFESWVKTEVFLAKQVKHFSK